MLLKTASILAALIFAGCFEGRATPDSVDWWTSHPMQKVRPHDPAPASPERAVRIDAARNEFEPFQVVLRARASGVDVLDVEVPALKGPEDSTITPENVTVYVQRFLSLEKASSPEGDAGEWPDPLVPQLDRYAGETRNALPLRLEEGRNQALWFEIYVPLSAKPGTYTGEVNVRVSGTPAIRVPVSLTVWTFALPSTSSLKTAFGFSGVIALKAHRGEYTSDAELLRLTRLYARSALLHRISTYGGSMIPPPFSSDGGRMRIDWSRYDREVGPFLDGKVLGPGDPLPGARVTTIDLRTASSAGTEQEKVSYWKEWMRHFQEKG
jgi:hypothetical protein